MRLITSVAPREVTISVMALGLGSENKRAFFVWPFTVFIISSFRWPTRNYADEQSRRAHTWPLCD